MKNTVLFVFHVASGTKGQEKVPNSSGDKSPKATPTTSAQDSTKKPSTTKDSKTSSQDSKPSKQTTQDSKQSKTPTQRDIFTPRSRDHIDYVLNLNKKEEVVSSFVRETLNILKEINKKLIQPLAEAYKFHDMGHSPISGKITSRGEPTIIQFRIERT